jgi:hypothetical protein
LVQGDAKVKCLTCEIAFRVLVDSEIPCDAHRFRAITTVFGVSELEKDVVLVRHQKEI